MLVEGQLLQHIGTKWVLWVLLEPKAFELLCLHLVQEHPGKLVGILLDEALEVDGQCCSEQFRRDVRSLTVQILIQLSLR